MKDKSAYGERQPRRVDFPPFFFHELRAGEGPPLVLLHGLGGSSEWWRYNIDALARQHTVAAVDFSSLGFPRSFEEIAALVARWIETSFDEKVHLAGNSMGGHV